MLLNCTNCQKEFKKTPAEMRKSKTDNHFCSKSCSATYNNSYRSRKDRRPIFKCISCGIEQKSTHSNQKYCNQTCQHSYQAKEKAFQLESGANLSHKVCKNYWLSKDSSCSCCGLSTWNNLPINLELDHINGDGTNNTLSNTRLLCPNCHSQTDTYKSKNAKNNLGKEFRKARYEKSLK